MKKAFVLILFWCLFNYGYPSDGTLDKAYLKISMASGVQSFWRVNEGKAVEGTPISIRGEKFKNGLGVHADSRIVFPLDGRFSFFHVVPGPDDAHHGTIEMKILIDGTEVYSSGKISRRDKKELVVLDIPLLGAKELTLIVNQADNNKGGDHASWGDAYFYNQVKGSDTVQTKSPTRQYLGDIPTLAQLKEVLVDSNPVTIENQSFSITFDNTGKLESIQRKNEGTKLETKGNGFVIVYKDAKNKFKEARLDHLALRGDMLVASNKLGFIVAFRVAKHQRYISLRMLKVHEPVAGSLRQLRFKLTASGNPPYIVNLDYVTKIEHRGRDHNVFWPWLWGRNEVNPLGAFAISLDTVPEEKDETLLHLWVNEGLPRPKVKGEWNLEAARQWLSGWQECFVDQSTMIVQPNDEAELYKLTDKAIELDMKKIYLHTDTWRGEYWPVNNSFLHVRKDIFPKGEASLKRYADYLDDHGLAIALHTVSCSIARYDTDYILNKWHPGLASWVSGVLTKDINNKDKIIHFKPDPGFEYFIEERHSNSPKSNVKVPWMNAHGYLINGEFIHSGGISGTETHTWTLRNCYRGDNKTQAKQHKAGDEIIGLLRPYSQAFMADPDSDLMTEIVNRYTDFCNSNHVNHIESDALENYESKPWGPRKFSWLVSERMNHYATSNTSSGRPLEFHMEYWFNSSQEVRDNSPTGGVAGGDGVPLFLDHQDRLATGPYEILLKPTQRLAVGGSSVNFMRPIPMFGINSHTLSSHGLTDYISEKILEWKKIAKKITSQQRSIMKKGFSRYRSPLNEARSQSATDVLYRPHESGNDLVLTPLRIMSRKGGETNWGWGQEYGPLIPRHYLELGNSLNLKNDYKEQVPEFIIRVLPQLNEKDDGRIEGVTASKSADLEGYLAGAGMKGEGYSIVNADYFWDSGLFENGKFKPSPVWVRKGFSVDDVHSISSAKLYVEADEFVKLYLNDVKVHEGKDGNNIVVIDIKDWLIKGGNKLAVYADNRKDAARFRVSINLVDDENEDLEISSSDWMSQSENPGRNWYKSTFNDDDWNEASVVSETFKALKRLPLKPTVVSRKLMPKSQKDIKSKLQKVDLKSDGINFSFHNKNKKAVYAVDDRPYWNVSANMFKHRGLEVELEGDGSNSLFVLTLSKHRMEKDYVIPIDFKGLKKTVIPNGEIAASNPLWAWRRPNSHFDYSGVSKISVGFGKVPANVHAKVKVKSIKVLSENYIVLNNPTVTLNQGSLNIEGEVPSDHYLWYLGGSHVGLYDMNWKKVANLPVTVNDFKAVTGMNEVSVKSDSPQGENIWFEMQFFTKDKSLIIKN